MTITAFNDSLTGFDWAIVAPTFSTASPGPDWFGALDACNTLRDQDCTDWHLASYKELGTLFAIGSEPTLWGPPSTSDIPWTSSPDVFDGGFGTRLPGLAWTYTAVPSVSTFDFDPSFSQVGAPSPSMTPVYCVRGP